MFPMIVAITVILGFGLVVYSRQSMPTADASPPSSDDHWHVAYGFNLCGEWYQLNGDLEETDSRGQFTNVKFKQAGIHSHADGIIHWHPFTSKAVGKRAKLAVFLDAYDVALTDESISFPASNELGGLAEWVEGETQCDGVDAQISVLAWNSITATDDGNRYIASMDQVHIDNDQMVLAIYFGTDDAPRAMPPWAADLPTLGAADAAQVEPEDIEPPSSTVAAVPSTSAPVESSTGSDSSSG